MKFEILCRIDKSYFSSDSQKYYTIVSTPAPDEFSMPSSFRLTSAQSLGNVGDKINAKIALSGYVRQKKYKDNKTGEMKDFTDCNTYLNVEKFSSVTEQFKKVS